jgi:predicted methyltransferase
VLAIVVTAALSLLPVGCARRRADPDDPYHDPRVTAEAWQKLFEGESRDIYRRRAFIMELVAVAPGMTVADVGAGTGLFSMLLADAVGPTGRVYAEEVVEKFSRLIAERAARERRENVVSVLGTEAGIGLPPRSVDLVFACDVYHHFDRPADMLASMRRALREEGELFLVDYAREPGLSPPWVLEHVRAGESEVTREVQAAGFELVSSNHDLGANYALRFRRSRGP